MDEFTSASEKIDADLCPICLDVFFTTQELLEHAIETYFASSISSCSKLKETIESGVDCPICEYAEFDTTSDLLKHMFNKHISLLIINSEIVSQHEVKIQIGKCILWWTHCYFWKSYLCYWQSFYGG